MYRRQVKKLHAFMMRHLRSIMHEDNLDGQSDKQGNTQTDRAAIYGRSSDQKESPVDRTPHEDVTRHLVSTPNWSQREREPSSPVQRYHQEKPEAERHKDRLHGHHSHGREINGEQQSSDGSSLCRFATDSMMMMTVT